jgi:hypothetical protein
MRRFLKADIISQKMHVAGSNFASTIEVEPGILFPSKRTKTAGCD